VRLTIPSISIKSIWSQSLKLGILHILMILILNLHALHLLLMVMLLMRSDFVAIISEEKQKNDEIYDFVI
jgi:hypothetical protein